MTHKLPAYDTLPWYKQFWPWFLISLPATVVVAGFVTLYIANKHSDDLVADDYYKNGLSINRQLEKRQRADEMNLHADFLFSGEQVEVRISGLRDSGNLTLTLSHPLEADQDFDTILRQMEPGVFAGDLSHTIAPRWHWILESGDTQKWRLDGSVIKGDFGEGRGL